MSPGFRVGSTFCGISSGRKAPPQAGKFWGFLEVGRVESLQKNAFLGVRKVKIELPTLRLP
mgnify:CR=1 FL=1